MTRHTSLSSHDVISDEVALFILLLQTQGPNLPRVFNAQSMRIAYDLGVQAGRIMQLHPRLAEYKEEVSPAAQEES